MGSPNQDLSVFHVMPENGVHDEGIDLFNHCAICLHFLAGDEGGSQSQDEVHCASDPKITTFQHLWPYLGMGREDENEFVFVKRASERVTSKVPPMCQSCYANILILNDLHVQMMKIKSRLLGQAKNLRDLMLEAGGADEKGENYTGRLKQFYEFLSKSGVMMGPLLKTMNFLCKFRGSHHLKSEEDPLKDFGSELEESEVEDWPMEAAFFNEDESSENEEDVKPDVSIKENDMHPMPYQSGVNHSDDKMRTDSRLPCASDVNQSFKNQVALAERERASKANDVTRFKCLKCKKQYSTKYRLSYHIRDGKCSGYPEGQEKAKETFPVGNSFQQTQAKVNVSYNQAAPAEQHSEFHDSSRFVCLNCKKQYSTKYRLNYHIRDGKCSGYPEREEKAKETFPVGNRHQQTKVKDNPSYSQASPAEQHSEFHDVTRFECRKCKKQYSTKYRLNYHVRDGKCTGYPEGQEKPTESCAVAEVINPRLPQRKTRRSTERDVSENDESNDDDYSPMNDSGERSSESENDPETSESEFEEPQRKRPRKLTEKSIKRRKSEAHPKNSKIQLYTTPTGYKKIWPRSQLCEVCNKRIRVAQMATHLQTHIKDYIYPCPNASCGLTYISPFRRDRVHLRNVPECLEKANLTLEDVSYLKCALCNFKKKYTSAFKAHLQEHENECETKSFACPFPSCSESFGLKQSVELHLNCHVYKRNPSFKKKQKCRLCPKYVDVCDLKTHYEESHQLSELFKCRQCPRIFVSLTQLMYHKKAHNKLEEGMLCDLCPSDVTESFENQATLAEHYLKAHDITGFSCPTCKKQYSTIYRLNYHIRDGKCTGYPEGQEKAKENSPLGNMDQQTEPKDNLKPSVSADSLHPPISEKTKELTVEVTKNVEADPGPKWKFGLEKSQVCEICNKRKRRSEMVEHLQSHVGEFVYKCPNPDCGLTYTSFARKTRHLRSTPECLKACNLTAAEAATMQCDLCDYKTDNKHFLLSHVKKHELDTKMESKAFPCPFKSCDKIFRVKQIIPFHLVSHTFYKGKMLENESGNQASVVFTPEFNAQLLSSCEEANARESYSDKWILGHERTQTCEVCNSRKRRRDMISHLREHGEKMKDYIYICPNSSCALCYISPRRRTKHLKTSPECLTASNITFDEAITMQCRVCHYVSNHPYSFRMHIQRHEEEELEKKYPCPISSCSVSFGVEQSIDYHLPSHVFRNNMNEKKNQSCPICKKCLNISMMERHLKKIHKVEEVFKCSQCPFMFSSEKKRMLHKKSHWRQGLGVAKCDMCLQDDASSSFDQFTVFLRHCAEVHGIVRDNNTTYLNTKSKGRPTSPKKGKTAETVANCESVDPGPDDPLIFKKRAKQRSFECTVCQPPIHFNSEERYLTHRAREHGGETYSCPICGKVWNSRATRNRHITEVHDPNSKVNKLAYCCELCGKRYRRPSQLSVHRRTVHFNQAFYCEHCGKMYKCSSKLRRHINITHFGIKKHVCPTCGLRLTSSYGLKVHMRVHTGEKPHSCKICGKSFSQRGSLATHEKTHNK